MKSEEIKIIEQNRKMLTDLANEVLTGSIETERAKGLLLQAKKMCEDLYTKTMNAMTDPNADLTMLRKKFPSEPFR